MPNNKRVSNEVNTGSMADIAFLLLIFFLVTTTIASDKGLAISLPPKPDEPIEKIDFNERNIFKVSVNSKDNIAIEDERVDDLAGIKKDAMEFILNFGNPDEEAQAFFNTLVPELKAMSKHDAKSSDYPTKPAVISFKTDRGTTYEKYVQVLDQLQGAFYEISAIQLGISVEDVRNIGDQPPSIQQQYDVIRKHIPMNISIAEPTKIGED